MKDAICKKNWKSNNNIFYSGKTYQIIDIRYFENENWYRLERSLENDTKDIEYIPNWKFKQYFYSESDIRKMKLEKLIKIFNI